MFLSLILLVIVISVLRRVLFGFLYFPRPFYRGMGMWFRPPMGPGPMGMRGPGPMGHGPMHGPGPGAGRRF